MIATIVVLGARGDLAGRYLYPALATLQAAGALGAEVRIVGVARRDWSDEEFRQHVRDDLEEHAGDTEAQAREVVVERCVFVQGDASEAATLRAAIEHGDGGPVVVYMALPNTVFGGVVSALHQVDLPQGSRLVVEKPFGTDQADARALNEALHEVLGENDIFRVDHFMAKSTVLNILGLRFANRILEPIWSAQHIASVDVVWDESLALEGRAGYYDRAGALIDMVQNHLLQVMALLAMEPPPSLSERDLRDRKVDLFRAVSTLTPEEVAQFSVRARYGAGTVEGRSLPAYVEEEGVDADRGTETYAEVVLSVDNWRWSGVPFRLRSGKAMASDRNEVVVRFKPAPHIPYDGGADAPANELRLTFGPDTMNLQLNVSGIGDPFTLDTTTLSYDMPPAELPAYSRLLLEVLEGDATLAIRGDEAEELWRIVDPVVAAWRSGAVPLQEYAAGSDGPLREG